MLSVQLMKNLSLNFDEQHQLLVIFLLLSHPECYTTGMKATLLHDHTKNVQLLSFPNVPARIMAATAAQRETRKQAWRASAGSYVEEKKNVIVGGQR